VLNRRNAGQSMWTRIDEWAGGGWVLGLGSFKGCGVYLVLRGYQRSCWGKWYVRR
jgi:hypothetical protein